MQLGKVFSGSLILYKERLVGHFVHLVRPRAMPCTVHFSVPHARCGGLAIDRPFYVPLETMEAPHLNLHFPLGFGSPR